MTTDEYPLKVLLVDDDLALRGVTATNLRKAGYDLEVATNGREGLDAAIANPPDVIVSDIMMPVMDGVTLLKKVREHDTISDAYVILLTAKDRTTDMVAGFEASADDYLTKPFNMAALLARVKAGGRIKRTQDDLRESNRKLEEAMRQRADLIGLAAHDLRNPISIITTYLSLLGRGIVSDESIRDVCLRRAQSLGSLLDSMLDISKIDSGNVPVNHPVRFSFGQVISEAADLYRPVAAQKQVELEILAKSECDLECDPSRMVEILNTLLEAGLALAREGSSLRIEHSCEEHELVLQIVLPECRMPADAKACLFAPQDRTEGTQLSDARVHIGLAIVRKLVEMLGGKVITGGDDDTLIIGFTLPKSICAD